MDLIFTSLSSKYNVKILDFELFLKIIEILTKKLYPEVNFSNALTFIVEKKILNLFKQNEEMILNRAEGKQHIKFLKKIAKNVEMVIIYSFFFLKKKN